LAKFILTPGGSDGTRVKTLQRPDRWQRGKIRATFRLAGGCERIENARMKRLATSLWICLAAYCGHQSNTVPLAFGMSPEQAALALGVPLVHHSGRRGADTYLAYGSPGIPGFYPASAALALQFRQGRLTGWKKDWRLHPPF
jgi:hypothetical protein